VKEGDIQTTVTSEDKDWLPVIRGAVVVPPELSAQTAEARVTFTVKGRAVEPSETMVVRNFRFTRNEDDKALPVATSAAPATRYGRVST
jgi:hypothetical protein